MGLSRSGGVFLEDEEFLTVKFTAGEGQFRLSGRRYAAFVERWIFPKGKGMVIETPRLDASWTILVFQIVV
ncbi:hypothetical protein PoB_001543800 [Plakobranchus ocellatus]|uniref:Uncharacterized protein n=1 Tax=Plakobranchus ocellatus TaxID=259542 RepID=A0AAV3Z2X4_9GAST|nr:hypothetical protein PoB_001543800 [Plakobranchus ocellatus]